MIDYSRHSTFNEMVALACMSLAQSGILVITGPTGTGKTHLAEHIHRHLFGTQQPYVSQEAAGFSVSRFESQIFGHVKGAFSGANQNYQGFLGAVGDGTLSLEGIEDLVQENQAKMLRFLQTRKYRLVGSNLEQRFAGKIIFTSSGSLTWLKRNQRLREDFLYRISGFELQMPTLMERPLDFENICLTMIEEIRNELGLSVRIPRPEEIRVLESKAIDGNLHGLRNLLQQAMIRGLPPQNLVIDQPEAAPTDLPNSGSLKADLHLLEGRLLERGLKLFPYSRKDLARYLGISLRSLMYKLKDHQLN